MVTELSYAVLNFNDLNSNLKPNVYVCTYSHD